MVKSIKNQSLSKVALENSSYSLILNLILKFGGLIFTVLIARILMPELFGIYSLALSVVTIVITFTDLGLDNTFLRYFSDALGKRNKPQARTYFKYLLKIKTLLIALFIIIIVFSAKFISYSIYDKPLLFFALIFSCLFIVMESLTSFFGGIIVATKNIKSLPILALLNQIMKILLSLLAISLVKYEFKVPGLFIAFAISGGIYLLLLFLIAYRKDKDSLIGPTVDIDKKSVNNYLKFMAIASLSLTFFGSIDILMLGKFVAVEYLGYYRAALSLIITIASLFSLSSIFLPVFTQISGKRFSRGFHKTLRYILILSIPATAGIIFIAKYVIKAVYGNEYILGTASIYFLSLLIITTPLIGLYSIIFQSKEKPKIVSSAVLTSLIVNVILNVLVIFLFRRNPLYMIAGVGLATSLSRVFLLGLLVYRAKREFNFKVRGIGLRAPIFATIIMSLFLVLFNHIVDMNIFFGAIEIILGVVIYFVVLILVKGIKKEDFELIKNAFKRKQV
jgi:O-antigen/teichoic acid export membrane protein